MDEKIVYIQSQITCALIELEAMKAANQEREQRGESLAYNEEAFMNLINAYPISHNAVVSYLQS